MTINKTSVLEQIKKIDSMQADLKKDISLDDLLNGDRVAKKHQLAINRLERAKKVLKSMTK